MTDDFLANIIESLKELVDDATVPKNIKEKVLAVVKILSSDEELSLKVSKAQTELEEISDDTNIQQYTRTQIWNIASMLEMV